jgi:hypothetical protein
MHLQAPMHPNVLFLHVHTLLAQSEITLFYLFYFGGTYKVFHLHNMYNKLFIA